MQTKRIRIALTLAFLVVAAPLAAEIYKSTDAEGNVIYTDRPASKDAEAVDIPPPTTYTPVKILPTPAAAQSSPAPQVFKGYKSVRISTPENDSTLTDPSGRLELTVAVEPSLQTEHKVRILMDSDQIAEQNSTKFVFENLDRGTHTLQAFIIDAQGRAIDLAEPITIHVRRPSAIFRKRSGG